MEYAGYSAKGYIKHINPKKDTVVKVVSSVSKPKLEDKNLRHSPVGANE